jgi:hypothetical protein
MRQASQASKTRVLRLKEPLSVRTDQFCRIGRAEPHNPAGISAHATHKQHRPRFYTAWTHSGYLGGNTAACITHTNLGIYTFLSLQIYNMRR